MFALARFPVTAGKRDVSDLSYPGVNSYITAVRPEGNWRTAKAGLSGGIKLCSQISVITLISTILHYPIEFMAKARKD